jgi:diguanylate cyclase (GGDEF)-like protein
MNGAIASPDTDQGDYKKVYSVAIEADDVVTRVLFNFASYEFKFNVHFQTYDNFESLLNAVEIGTVDFAANVTFTPERAERFDFSSPTNIEYTYLYSKEGITFSKLNTIGVPAATIYSELIKTHYPELTQIEYNGGREAIDLLQNGQVDGIVDAINQLKPMLNAGYNATLLNDYIPIQPVSIIATKNSHIDMLKQLEVFAHSPAIQRELSKSIQRYQIDIRKQSLRNVVLDSGLDRKKIYKIKLENGGQYVQYNANGSVSGISAELVLDACEILALRCQLVSHEKESWSTMYNDLLENRIDILSPIIKSAQREQLMHFSDSYYQPAAIMVKRKGYKNDVYNNVSELLIERIGVVKDDFFQTLLEKMLPNKKLVTYDNQNDLIEALIDNEVDYVASSRSFFEKMLSDSDELLYIEEDSQIGRFHHSEIAIAFPHTDEGATLATLFSRAMKIININNIVRKYEVRPDWRERLLLEKQVTRQEMLLMVAILILLAGMVTYLHIQSNTDGLTKLRNRRSLYRRYSRGVSPRTSVIYLDVNNFKEINDSYGHETGDKVLQQLTSKINTYWKGNRYRIGGDEFILTGVIEEEKLQEILIMFEHFTYIDLYKKVNFSVSVSMGVSAKREGHASLEEVLHLADVEMYRSKYSHRSGKLKIIPSHQDSLFSTMLSDVSG